MAVLVAMILLGALGLGLLSWGLGVAALVSRKEPLSVCSLICCALALLLACTYFYGGVQCEDWSALMDTAGAMLLSASVLTAVNLLLNGGALVRRYLGGKSG